MTRRFVPLATPCVIVLLGAPLAGAPPNARVSVPVGSEVLERLSAPRTPGERITTPALPLLGEGLDLEEFSVFTPDAALRVVTAEGVKRLPLPRKAFLRGTVAGKPGSLVLLTATGPVEGIILSDGERYVLTAAGAGDGLLLSRTGPIELPEELAGLTCSTLTPSGDLPPTDALPLGVPPPPAATSLGSAVVAIEVDYELFRFLGGRDQVVDYVSSLFAAVSTIFARDVGVELVVGQVIIQGAENDPWTQFDASAELREFSNVWATTWRNSIPRQAAYLLYKHRSGTERAVGCAWLGTLCEGNSYSEREGSWVGAYGTAQVYGWFSILDPAFSYDVHVVAHEMGHTFGSPHTHCYSPPVDRCHAGECYQGTTSRPANGGTIMSYCQPLGSDSLHFGRVGEPSEAVLNLLRSQAASRPCVQAIRSCPGDVSPLSTTVPASSTTTTISVSAEAACKWAPTTGETWMRITSPVLAYGSARVTVEVDRNPSRADRTGFVHVVDRLVAVKQSGDPSGTCAFGVGDAVYLPATGGTVGSAVRAPPGCAWKAVSDASWFGTTSAGNGPGYVVGSAGSNSGAAARTARVRVGDTALVVTQGGALAGAAISLSLPGGKSLSLARVPGGVFTMGRHPDSSDWDWLWRMDETPAHEVILSSDYYVSKLEVTRAQWRAVMGADPDPRNCEDPGRRVAAGDDELPVTCLYGADITAPDIGFLARLNQYLLATKQPLALKLRLPSEAEWERAAWGGAVADGPFPFSVAWTSKQPNSGCPACPECSDYMWWCGNTGGSGPRTTGQKRPNGFGIHDMLGNASEWVQDLYGPYGSGPVVNPSGPADGVWVLRGGSWASPPTETRPSARSSRWRWEGLEWVAIKDAGFRVAASLDGCSFNLKPASAMIPASGLRDQTFDVQTQPECAWSVGTTSAWIQVAGPTSGIGPGTVRYHVESNPSTADRTGTIPVGSLSLTVRQFSWSPGGERTVYLPGSVPMTFTVVPGGMFTRGMGVTTCSTKPADVQRSCPEHRVTLTQDYYMGRSEVTQAQWQAVMGTNPAMTYGGLGPGPGIGPDFPVYGMTRNDIVGPGGFLESLRTHLTRSGQTLVVDLPTDAQWERASGGRALNGASGWWFDTSGAVYSCPTCGACPDLDDKMWYCGNAGSRYHPVGQTVANPYGLYDMYGNAAEWVRDGYAPYTSQDQTDPFVPFSGTGVERGGLYQLTSRETSAWYREAWPDDLRGGLRLQATYDGCSYVMRPQDTRWISRYKELLWNVSDQGAELALDVFATPSTCSWTAVPNVPWIKIESGSQGTASGTLRIRAEALTTEYTRTGTLSLGGKVLTVSQSRIAPISFGGPCAAVSPSPLTLTSGASTQALLDVRADSTCAWTAVTSSPWLQLQPSSGSGSGTVTVSASANPGLARTGMIDIARQSVIVEQPAPLRAGACSPSKTTLCLDDAAGDGRFKLTVTWSTVQGGGQAGQATAVSLGAAGIRHGGMFAFFGIENPEVLVKVLNGCAVNGQYWVFASAGTNVGMSIQVTDTARGLSRTYQNPDLTAARPVQDVLAFPCSAGAATEAPVAP